MTTTYLDLAAAALIGLVVPMATRWLMTWLEKRLTADRDAILAQLSTMHLSAEDNRRRLDGHDIAIARLEGAQAERAASGAEHILAAKTAAETASSVAATAVAAAREVVRAADLLAHPEENGKGTHTP